VVLHKLQEEEVEGDKMKVSGSMPKVSSGASAKKPAPKSSPKMSSGGAIGKKGAKINIAA
jgi:hypothetical protein